MAGHPYWVLGAVGVLITAIAVMIIIRAFGALFRTVLLVALVSGGSWYVMRQLEGFDAKRAIGGVSATLFGLWMLNDILSDRPGRFRRGDNGRYDE